MRITAVARLANTIFGVAVTVSVFWRGRSNCGSGSGPDLVLRVSKDSARLYYADQDLRPTPRPTSLI